MKFRNRPLVLAIVFVLVFALMLPMFCACDRNEKDDDEDTEETVQTTKEDDKPNRIPVVDMNGASSGDSLASTPNKGGSSMVVSGSDSVKSAFSLSMEKLEEAQKNAFVNNSATIEARRNLAEQYMRTMLTVRWTPKA